MALSEMWCLVVVEAQKHTRDTTLKQGGTQAQRGFFFFFFFFLSLVSRFGKCALCNFFVCYNTDCNQQTPLQLGAGCFPDSFAV